MQGLKRFCGHAFNLACKAITDDLQDSVAGTHSAKSTPEHAVQAALDGCPKGFAAHQKHKSNDEENTQYRARRRNVNAKLSKIAYENGDCHEQLCPIEFASEDEIHATREDKVEIDIPIDFGAVKHCASPLDNPASVDLDTSDKPKTIVGAGSDRAKNYTQAR